MRAAFSDALVALAQSDPRVLLLTGDHGYALFDPFRQACPDQYINCGIAEQNMVGVAAGLARAGFRPVVYGLAAFVPVRVLEQIKMDICYEQLPVILIGDGAGFVYSHLGSSHQSTEDIACTRALPELAILSPADRFEMSSAMHWAYERHAPVYLRMGKSDRGDVHAQPLSHPISNPMLVHAGDPSVCLIATGSMVKTAMTLVSRGLQATVWSVPTLKPLTPSTLLQLTAGAQKVVTLEEHSVMGGLGSCVTEALSMTATSATVLRIGVDDRFSQYCGSYEYLLKEHGLDDESVHQRVNAFVASTHVRVS